VVTRTLVITSVRATPGQAVHPQRRLDRRQGEQLPVGQRLNEEPINGDNTLGTLGSRFAHGWYVGISFTFSQDKETEFLNALTPPQKTGQGTADTNKEK